MEVTCSICGQRYDMRDPGIRRIWGEDTWECAEEGPCFDRRAMAHLTEGTNR